MTILKPLRALDHALSRSGRVRRILVDSRTPVNHEMVAPVVRAMQVDPRVEFAFTASEDPGALEPIYRQAPAGTRLIAPSRAAFMQWDAYLTSDFMWATLPRCHARIQMFHGVAGKYGFDAPDVSMRSWDRLFFVNARRLRNFVEAGAIDANSAAAQLIGMPKVDCLVDGSLRQGTVRAQFGLDPARPTVLYAPTWSPASSLNHMGMALVERLAAMPVNLIVKLHDRSRDPRPQYSGGVDWAARLSPALARAGATLAASANITPCLAAADVMVSDHSSAAFEFLLLDRPLVRIELPALIQQANVHADYVDLLASASHNVTSAEAAAQAVDQALGAPAALSATRRRVAADLFYRPGSATARCAAALYDVLQLPAHPSIAAALDDPARAESVPCLQSA